MQAREHSDGGEPIVWQAVTGVSEIKRRPTRPRERGDVTESEKYRSPVHG